jgi:hypothetical protein
MTKQIVPFHNFAKASKEYSKTEIGRECVETARTTCAHLLNQVLEVVLRFQFWSVSIFSLSEQFSLVFILSGDFM